jgi:hypothetical protein
MPVSLPPSQSLNASRRKAELRFCAFDDALLDPTVCKHYGKHPVARCRGAPFIAA